MTIQTRIPTLFEVGTVTKNSDGAPVTDWEEGRDLQWQVPAKNPHPNKYTIVFKDGAFRTESLAIFLNSDARLKKLFEKSSPFLKEMDLQRGTKRDRTEDSDSESGSDMGSYSSDEESREAPPAKKKKKLIESDATKTVTTDKHAASTDEQTEKSEKADVKETTAKTTSTSEMEVDEAQKEVKKPVVKRTMKAGGAKKPMAK